MLTEILGWSAAAITATLALPQVIRLLRVKTTAGVSPTAWQVILAANLAWCGHGLYTNHPNVWLPNVLLALCSTTILLQLARLSGRNIGKLILPAFLLGALIFGFDLGLGPLAFAVAALLPPSLAQLAQLRALIVSPTIQGVSMAFLLLSVLNQVLWVSWALRAQEMSVTVVGCSLGSLMLVNLVWATMRRFDLVAARPTLLPS